MSFKDEAAKGSPDADHLSPKQIEFLKHYLATGNGMQSALKAGYAKGNASRTASLLINHNPAFQKALKAAREEAIKDGSYNLKKAMAEADEAISFAKETENANAFVKAVELKAKLNGLLIEKHELIRVPLEINIMGIGARPSLPALDVTPIVEAITSGSDKGE